MTTIRSGIIVGLLLILTAGAARPQANEIVINANVNLLAESGEPITINDYKSYLRLIFFGYTQCPDICPLTMYFVAGALKSLGPDAERVRVLFITIDPKRDTPAVLAKYTDAFHSSIIGLSGAVATIDGITEALHTTYGYTLMEDGRERPVSRSEYEALTADAPYVPYHSSQIYILDQKDRLVDVIGYGSDSADMAVRIREHLETID
ncbi:MAG: electron transporter [Gammaproteobacteria bacterium]|nr:electron transporter [Gammaproteobacteria bacterium]